MNKTQKRVYDYIKYLCNACILVYPYTHDKFNNMCVLLSRQDIANKLCLSNKTIERALEYLINNKHIYRKEIGHNYIYSINPINDKYIFCMAKVSS